MCLRESTLREGGRQSSQEGGSRCYRCLVPRFSAQWFLAMNQSASFCDGLPTVDVLFHSRREKSRCIKCIPPTATLNRSCYSKFIAYLEAPQHRNSCFQYTLRRSSTLPQNTTITTPCQIREGIFSLPDPTSFLPKILMLGSHRTHCWTPCDTQAHKGRQQQITETPPGHKFRHTACIPADSNIHL